ncbi:hypothetical protein CROQUDRAFT_99308 [Cronartium quercuum f. sp. fusiforme G11]|uniref:Uncharacterized protein n=1 Tax=Cronartium quercuum f. sp. fusiforme G11 TaxID=708437 RepID=A0A9P6T6Y1_9BASI|nr:hypothetical protein CROQUDRAFT_99308 [Cronartium quercuum f. sp. fusiforme G11]
MKPGKGRKKQGLAMQKFKESSKIRDPSVTPTEGQDEDLIPIINQPKLFSTYFIQEGRLGLGQAGASFDDLEDWFGHIKEAWNTQLREKRVSQEVVDVIPHAIEKTFCHLVLAFLGGLKVMYYGSETKMSTKVLMQEGSKYLQHLMTPWQDVNLESIKIAEKQEERAKQDTDWSVPDILLRHLFRNNIKTPYVSHTLIVYLLGQWSEWASKHEGLVPMSLDWNSFQKTCIEVVFQKTGDTFGIKLETLGEIYDSSVNSRNPRIQSRPLVVTEESNESTKSHDSVKFFQFLKNAGQSFFKTFGELGQQKKNFFEELERTLVAKHLGQNKHPENIEDPSKDLRAMPCLKMVYNAIEIVEAQIAPAFVGILVLLNGKKEEHSTNSTLKNLLLHGWAFLQEYFSQWKDLNMNEKDSTGIYMFERQKFRGRIQFQSPRRTMQFYMKKEKSYSEYSVAWYLAEVWYDSVFYEPFDQRSAIAFEARPLDENILKNYFSKNGKVAGSQRISFDI